MSRFSAASSNVILSYGWGLSPTWTSMFEKWWIAGRSRDDDCWNCFGSSLVRCLHLPLPRPPNLREKNSNFDFTQIDFTWVRNSNVCVGTRDPRFSSVDNTGSWCYIECIIIMSSTMVMIMSSTMMMTMVNQLHQQALDADNCQVDESMIIKRPWRMMLTLLRMINLLIIEKSWTLLLQHYLK